MTTANAQHQRAHRERRAAERERMAAAIRDGIRRLGNADDSWHNGFRDMLTAALPATTAKGEG